MRQRTRRWIIQVCAGGISAIAGCSSSNRSEGRVRVPVKVIINNRTEHYYRGDLVVLDKHGSEIFGRDGVGWESGESYYYNSKAEQQRVQVILLKIFLDTGETTIKYENEYVVDEPNQDIQLQADIQPGPKVKSSG
ncbi:hypothetical protein [Haloarchaeobius sp. DYHT-AS-18]|uniref:hypothetical protein n=1 Tax=Haloarchaeobius sp. DYHT-AS-18 TaxID=3446117 RepID=UPI003EB88F7F